MFGNVLKHGTLALSLAVSLIACGGGGGDPSVPDNLPNSGTTASLTFSVIDPSTGLSTTILNTADGNTINISLVDNAGAALASEFVTVSSTVGTVSPSSGSVLTDASGNTSVTITSSGVDSGTAGIITVAFNNTTTGASDTETLNVQVGSTISGGGGSGAVITLSSKLYDQREYGLDPTDATGTTTATEIDRINIVQPATLEATLLLDGVPVDNAIIITSSNLGALDPTSGSIITNELGIATINLSVGTAVSGEAGTISVTTADTTNSLSFGVGSATLKLGTGSGTGFSVNSLDITDTTLSASGNTGVTVNVVDATNTLFTTPVQVSFSSGCVSSGDSTIDSPVTTVGGIATASYSVAGCENSDTITAEIVGVAGPSANGTVSIIASIPNSIAFTSASPTNIALKGTGGSGRVENSDVTFQIIDNTGAPEAGVIVNFSLTTSTGGITLVDNTGQSNANGQVTAKVSSGNIPTPVRVIATISLDTNGNSVSDVNGDSVDDNDATVNVTETISTVSDLLIISTGLPDQNSFTIAASSINPGGGDTIGVTSTISILAADKFNNPVPDGTAISFTTEFGAIDPSCTTTGGSCSVTWRSQNPRAHLTYTADDIRVVTCNTTTNGNTINIPCRQDTNFATPHGAYSTIVASALGEETFVDANGDGLFNTGETFDDIPEIFVDHNDDGEFGNINTVGSCSPNCSTTDTNGDGTFGSDEGDDEETFTDFDSDGIYDPADGIYNGSLCSSAAETAGNCSTQLLNVSESLFVVLSSQSPAFGVYRNNVLLNGSNGNTSVAVNVPNGSDSLTIDISDHFNGPLPEGTTVAVSSTNCDIDSPVNFSFGSGDIGFLTIPVSLSEDSSSDGNFGVVTITVTTPTTNNLSGAESSYSLTCRDND